MGFYRFDKEVGFDIDVISVIDTVRRRVKSKVINECLRSAYINLIVIKEKRVAILYRIATLLYYF